MLLRCFLGGAFLPFLKKIEKSAEAIGTFYSREELPRPPTVAAIVNTSVQSFSKLVAPQVTHTHFLQRFETHGERVLTQDRENVHFLFISKGVFSQQWSEVFKTASFSQWSGMRESYTRKAADRTFQFSGTWSTKKQQAGGHSASRQR